MRWRCLLMAQSGHAARAGECPLLGVKETLVERVNVRFRPESEVEQPILLSSPR